MKKFVFICGYILLTLQPAHSAPLIRYLKDQFNYPPLAKTQGYLLLYVDVAGIAPSIEFAKMKYKRNQFYGGNKKRPLEQHYSLVLKNKAPGLYVVPLLAGDYQITRVNAPYYDLPYWRPTEQDDSWRFTVAEQQVNYIGELKIAKERGNDFIDVSLFNRFARYHEVMLTQYSELLGKYPLLLNPGYRDDFQQKLDK